MLWDGYIAELLHGSVEVPFGKTVPEFRGLTMGFISRHVYATIGVQDPPIRINPFRRFRFPDGSMESVEDGVGRVDRVFAAQFKDWGTRLQQQRNGRAVTGCLIAAERPIGEYPRLFDDDPTYRRSIWRRQQELGTFDDPFVARQRAIIEEAMRLSPRDRRDELHSLVNLLEPFVGGALGAFFSNENVALEDVVYGGKRLFLSASGLNGTEQRKFAMRIIWAACDTLIAKRRFIDQEPIGVEVIDELSWLPADFFDVLTRRRNFRWSTVTLRQTVHQMEELGFTRAHELSAASSATHVTWDAETLADARELAARIHPIDPTGWWVDRLVETHSAAESAGSQLGQMEGVSEVDTHTRTTGTTLTEKYNVADILTGKAKSLQSSDGYTRGTQRQKGTQNSTSHQTTHGVSRTLQPHRIGFDEQLSAFAQSLLQLPDHVAVVRAGRSKPRRVLMRRPRELQLIGIGEEILESYLRLNIAAHDASAKATVPLNPPIVVAALPTPPRPEASSVRTASAVADRPTRRPSSDPPEVLPIDDAAAANDDEPSASTATAPTTVTVSVPLPGVGSREEPERTVLALAATTRFLTVQTVILLTTWSYDKAYRELEAQRKAGHLDRFQPPVGREKGSAPSVYVLSGEGASRLAPHWTGGIEDLRRTVKNTGTKRRDVEEGNATNLNHALATTAIFALLARRVRTVDPTAVIDSVYWDRSLSIPVDVGPWIAPLTPRERLLVSPEVAAGITTITTYVPDVTLRVTWQPPGYRERITEVLLVEVETGAGGKDSNQVGAVKGVKLAGVLAAADASGRVGPIAVTNPRLVKAIFWCGTASVEDGIRIGLRRVLTSPKRPFFTTNAALLPLAPPSGTAKKDLPAALDRLAEAVGGPVWKWYQEDEHVQRFGYPRLPKSPR